MELRFQNKSAETFTRLDVNVLGIAYSFDTLRAGELTRPVAVMETYYYCPLKVFTKQDTLRWRPVDYIGEKLYTHGKMTIEIVIKTGKHFRTGRTIRYLDTDAARGRWMRRLKERLRP